MVLDFSLSLVSALAQIGGVRATQNIPLHLGSVLFDQHHDQSFLDAYGGAKWQIVDILNEQYSSHFESPIDLHNWLRYNEADEIAYFLNEAGNNVLHYSQFRAPSAFEYWLGEHGFIVAVAQNGRGFDAERVNAQRLKQTGGAAFEFYRRSKSIIFFDNPQNATVAYLLYLF